MRLPIILIDHSPLGLFRANETNNWNKLNRLRIPTGKRSTSWLCTSAAEELNQRLPGTNPAISGQSVTRTLDLQISNPARSNHSATLPLRGLLLPYQLVWYQILVFHFPTLVVTQMTFTGNTKYGTISSLSLSSLLLLIKSSLLLLIKCNFLET